MPVGGGMALPSENSHVIRLGEVSTKSENVAIPTMGVQNLKLSWGNYVRNWVGPGLAGGPPPTAQTGPTKTARANTSIHSFTATLPKVI